ncbi:MAG: cytochrome-c oxidase, cbb3-type subunit I [Chitinophagales bacterium]|nr:cytochrome-c oxidase, cbb3-type subunit I [Chitinophagales bacterium]OJV26077.1 MAG: cytochrome C oxidase Cbb3 [Bacteroidetes bacterium 37-13]HRP38388.1 cytochrome-c oxidase, cbb3-type subunit I [Chitinophagales bacterium]
MEIEKFSYDNKIVRNFAYATFIWGLVGLLVGLIVALQLVIPDLNFPEYFTFGRMRPLHTNAVVFAFVGNGIFMGVYYSLQRLCKARMWNDTLSAIHFWGWQLIIVLAAVTLLMGFTSSKEYAELEWPIDVLITIIWVIFGINIFGTILTRRVQHLYVAIWFYIATWITVAMLHIVNSLAIPVTLFKSYPIYAGVQDALVQWWYGHNAVAFFLTTPYLGLMYYFLPKAAGRPVYSYRLSIIHFWSLIFLYIWAGPHHLLYTALPDWAQSLGTVFSIMLLAPSWGGMINGLLTLRGAWDKVRDDVVLKFYVVAVTAYGMATFEGPMLSIKSVNAISHYTDWTIAHVHIGALGWNGFLTFGVLFWLIPKIFRTELYSRKLANIHFWLGTLGILFYAVPLYWSAWTQWSLLGQFKPEGVLMYPNFLDTLSAILPMYYLRAFGGFLYLLGAVIGVVNLVKTVQQGKLEANEAAEAPPLPKEYKPHSNEHWHRWIERKPVQMLIGSLVVVAIGGIIEFAPTFLIESNVPTIASVKPYTPLELQGRDIYVREGCYVCHSQMVRPFREEVARYGEYSKAGEFVYDHPFQWGSKRTGPDLARVGTRNLPNSWHYNHMDNPRSVAEQSIMPPYPHLLDNDLDIRTTKKKIQVMQKLGVPYPKGYEDIANDELMKQAKGIQADLKMNGITTSEKKEIIALIAYMQRLGKDIKGESTFRIPASLKNAN